MSYVYYHHITVHDIINLGKETNAIAMTEATKFETEIHSPLTISEISEIMVRMISTRKTPRS